MVMELKNSVYKLHSLINLILIIGIIPLSYYCLETNAKFRPSKIAKRFWSYEVGANILRKNGFTCSISHTSCEKQARETNTMEFLVT